MRGRTWLSAAAFLAALVAAMLTVRVSAAQQQPASIEGIVVTLGTGVPVSGVRVTLTIRQGRFSDRGGETVLLTDALPPCWTS